MNCVRRKCSFFDSTVIKIEIFRGGEGEKYNLLKAKTKPLPTSIENDEMEELVSQVVFRVAFRSSFQSGFWSSLEKSQMLSKK